MSNSLKAGFSFGLTSGVITTLGLIVGLYASTQSKTIIISSILIIAISDAFSDSLGIHTAEEAQHKEPEKEVWKATIITFLSKFFFAISFISPFLFFNLLTGLLLSFVWGMFLLSMLSFFISKKRKKNPLLVISEHLFIAILVILISYNIGNWIFFLLK